MHSRQSSFQISHVLALVLAAFLPASTGQAIYVGVGFETTTPPSVGAVVEVRDPTGELVSHCTGTLIGCNTVVTAAHCVFRQFGDTEPAPVSERKVFFQNYGVVAVADIKAAPSFSWFSLGTNDIAVIKLAEPVTGIGPMELRTTALSGVQDALIVGFGRSNNGYTGLKRLGLGKTQESCTHGVLGFGCGSTVCFDVTQDPATHIGDVDSGGPLLTGFGYFSTEPLTIAGVASCGGVTYAGAYGNVSHHLSWLNEQLAAFEPPSCGGEPVVGAFPGMDKFFKGTLSAGSEQVFAFDFDNVAQTGTLRVTMTGDDDATVSSTGVKNFDLYARRGADPTSSVYDCKSDGLGQYEACELTGVPSDDWHVMVKDSSAENGGGQFQITATHFPGDSDSDGVLDPFDNCPAVANPDQADSDTTGPNGLTTDGVGDACDNCILHWNPDQADTESFYGFPLPDGYGDACEPGCFVIPGGGTICTSALPCAGTSNPGCFDECGIGDTDLDGVPNYRDNCIPMANPGQEDSDGNGVGDPCLPAVKGPSGTSPSGPLLCSP